MRFVRAFPRNHESKVRLCRRRVCADAGARPSLTERIGGVGVVQLPALCHGRAASRRSGVGLDGWEEKSCVELNPCLKRETWGTRCYGSLGRYGPPPISRGTTSSTTTRSSQRRGGGQDSRSGFVPLASRFHNASNCMQTMNADECHEYDGPTDVNCVFLHEGEVRKELRRAHATSKALALRTYCGFRLRNVNGIKEA